MKALVALILALLLFACKKPDRSITYSMSCHHCSARYLDADGVSRYVIIGPDTIFVEVDSVFNGADSTFLVIDTIIDLTPYSWSTSFDVEHDAPLHFGIARLSVQGIPTTAKRTIDGRVETKVIDRAEYVEFE